MGRKKVEIKRIENKDARHVTFSKRRAGLFKKLAEICLLSGGEAAALVCSPGGKLHLFAHPHESLVFNRFTAGENNILVPSELGRERKNESEFRTEFAELQAVLEAERDRRRWWEETDLDGLHVEKLTGIRSSLADLRMGVVARMAHLEREREE